MLRASQPPSLCNGGGEGVAGGGEGGGGRGITSPKKHRGLFVEYILNLISQSNLNVRYTCYMHTIPGITITFEYHRHLTRYTITT